MVDFSRMLVNPPGTRDPAERQSFRVGNLLNTLEIHGGIAADGGSQ